MLRRRPVLRAAATTAVVAGTATAVSGRVRRRQNRRFQRQAEADAYEQGAYEQPMEPAAPPAYAAPPPAPTMSTVEQLKELAALRDQGVLNDAEFDAEKAKILAS
jgi:Short C-terminal domain